MKTLIAIAIFSLYCLQTTLGQTDSTENRKIYQTWIYTLDSPRLSTGVLYEIQDSSVTLSNRNFSRKGSPGKVDMTQLDVRSIDVIKLRKKGNVSKGILFGSLAGLVLGGALDLIYYSSWQKPKEDNSLESFAAATTSSALFAVNASLIGVLCLGTGIGIGAIIGSAKINIPINGSQDQFDENKSALNVYSIKFRPELESKSFSKLRDTLADFDGNVYHTVALGGQVWMAEDLKVSHYRDGSEIHGLTKNDHVKGRQYNWNEANDKRNLCPAGWHVPSLSEWNSLFNSLGGENRAGPKLGKDFSARGKEFQWWTATEVDANNAKGFYLSNQTSVVMITTMTKTSTFQVRCIRDY
jgi:hypothetical protein